MKKLLLSVTALISTCAILTSEAITTAALSPAQDTTGLPTIGERLTQLENQVDALAAKTGKKKKSDGVHSQYGDRIAFSGGLDTEFFSSNLNNPSAFTTPDNQSLDLNVAYLNFNALLTPWMRTFTALTYEPGGVTTTTGGAFTAPEVEQAYVQFSKPQSSNLFLDVGKQYLPFGSYNRYPVVNSLMQSLAEINKVAMVGGLDYKPFFTSVYIFSMQGTLGGFNSSAKNQLANGGLEAGFLQVSPTFGYEASLGYLSNMAETRFIYGVIKATNESVGALAGHVSFNVNKLGFVANAVGAVRNFDAQDIQYNGGGAQP